MINLRKIFLAALILAVPSCGGGGGSAAPDLGVDIPITVDTNDLQKDVVNNFNGSLEIVPTALEFGATSQGKPLIREVIVKNNTDVDQNLVVKMTSGMGTFAFFGSEGRLVNEIGLLVGPQASRTFTLRYAAPSMGTHTGILEVTSRNLEGLIRFPFRASTTKGIKIISASYFCSDDQAPWLNKIDFQNLSSGLTKKFTFKVCNTGDNSIKVNQVTFEQFTGTELSRSLLANPFEPFSDELTDVLGTPFSYFNPPSRPAFSEPNIMSYPGALPQGQSVFTVSAYAGDKTMSPFNLVIPSQGSINFDVVFKPVLNQEAPDNSIFEPIPVSADMMVNTSLINAKVSVVGSTSGTGPELKVVKSEIDKAPPSCSAGNAIPLDNLNASINFGSADVFKNFIGDDTNAVTLRLCNVGSGSKLLKVWADPMTKGYFTYAADNLFRSFPLQIAAGGFADIKINYSPTPHNGLASTSFDFGHLVLKHNGANGPMHRLALVGQQQQGEVMQVTDGVSNLRQNYPAGKAQSICLVKNGEARYQRLVDAHNKKAFFIKNNSNRYTVRSQWNLTLLSPLGAPITMNGVADNAPANDNTPADKNNAVGILKIGGDIATPKKSFGLAPGSAEANSKSFEVQFALDNNLRTGDYMRKGSLTITNTFLNAPDDYDSNDFTYTVPLNIFVKNSIAECESVGGQPIDGYVTAVLDRFTMILPKINEPARNHPSGKFHLPMQLDKTHKWVRIDGSNFRPDDMYALDQLKFYAHQTTTANAACFPISPNPYCQEFETCSWNGPFQCSHVPTEEGEAALWKVDEGTTCIPNNGSQEETIVENGQERLVDVYYHEFVKFNGGCGTPAIEGKVSTFFKEKDQSVVDVFQRMRNELAPSSSQEQYDSYTRPFSFNSYIKFNEAYPPPGGINAPDCTYPAGTVLHGATDSEAIKKCWAAFQNDKQGTRRVAGMIEECSYFNFEIASGCFPRNTPGVDPNDPKICSGEFSNSSYDDPDTWVGFGEYEVDPNDPEKYDLTIRNINLKVYSLSPSFNSFFGHKGRLLFSTLNSTFTTKAVGRTYLNNNNPNDDRWDDLIDPVTRRDFTESTTVLASNDPLAVDYWIESGVNNAFNVGDDDQGECTNQNGIHCRGNYQLINNKLYHAGEPINFSNPFNRMLMVGFSGFHGKEGLAPFFAQEVAGQGAPLYFSFHGCLRQTELNPDGTLIPIDPHSGCYEPKLDEKRYLDAYESAGILEPEDIDDANVSESKAYINYQIFDEDRNRFTNYYDNDPLQWDDAAITTFTNNCGFGM